MGKRRRFSLALLVFMLAVAVWWQAAQLVAQVDDETPDLFLPIRTIGATRPSGLRYEPVTDRFAWVDPQGQLVLVDAATLATQHILYSSGAYEAFAFSRDGRSLAVAIGVRVEVWDTDSGVLVAVFEPPGANRVQGPLQFTRNDELLLFDSIVPAPQELRRSENDTIILPWVWDVAAARDQRPSVLVNRVEAYPFYDIRVSMIAGGDGILVGGLDNRIQVFDADSPTMAMIADLPAERLETVPVVAWRSATDPYVYVSLNTSGSLLQISTETNAQQQIELGRDLNSADLERFDDIPFSRALRVISDGTAQVNPLTERLLGQEYASQSDYRPGEFVLLDVLIPLTDDPLGSAAGGTALLTYNFIETYGYGAIDLLRPLDIGSVALSPNGDQLALRRLSGRQPVELYDLETGALERLFTPNEPDPESRRPFAYTDDGQVLVIDFERYDSETGERLARAEAYTQPFSSYDFTDDNRLITFGGTPFSDDPAATTWRVWDIETGRLLREEALPLRGEVLRRSDDNLRYLTYTTQSNSTGVNLALQVIDLNADEAQTYTLPLRTNFGLNSVIPNDDWTRFAILYGGIDEFGSPLTPMDVYTREGDLLYSDAGNNLPVSASDYTWLDDRTIAMRWSQYGGGGVPAAPGFGLVYHPSGLPQCVVAALPDSWRSLLPIWERVLLDYGRSRLDALTVRLCAALTGEDAQNVNAAQGTPAVAPNATDVVALLTPTPGTYYQSARTPAPIAIPGVPVCITRNYQREAIVYADLWREITAGVTDSAQLAELETMICEGLLGSLSGVQPTATINPDTLTLATPTPMDAAPITTGGDEVAYSVLLLDVETGARTLAENYVPPTRLNGSNGGFAEATADVGDGGFRGSLAGNDVPPRISPASLLGDFFFGQFGVYPADPVVSPDGVYVAARNDAGFVTVYRLLTPYTQLEQNEAAAVVARETQGPRSIGLLPTGTPPPEALGAALPTLTPTVTLTPLPLTQAQTSLPEWGEVDFLCPRRTLASLADAPPDFAPPGLMIVRLVGNAPNVRSPWALDPRTGVIALITSLPPCGITENCNPSPDGEWMVRQQIEIDGSLGDIVVSRPNGDEPVTLYTATDARLISPSFSWRAPHPHLLQITFSGVLPTFSPNPITLVRTYDPDTGVRSAEALPPTVQPLGLLPFEVVSRQPNGTLELVVEYPLDLARYLLRDTATGVTTAFAQPNQGSLPHEWQPAGQFLYYEANGRSFVYDVARGEHAQLTDSPNERIPRGVWSPNGQLRADWRGVAYDVAVETLMEGELPARLQIWDSVSGRLRTYCLPEAYLNEYSGTPLVWSPDNRYLAFTVNLPIGGDLVPTPTFAISPEAPVPTPTPVPLEAQFEAQFPHTLILDVETGIITIVSREANLIERWIGE